ncbi:gliding motility protein GldN [Mucilaginibacter terrae]|uniref:type IX secretion system ring protein PorN/GldN n=1 Tax=Mucilaginibacter terrae TaxID=1955052 RepID=UPI00363A3C33
MKNLAHKIYITAFCLLGILFLSSTADAQKKKSRSTKAKSTVKAKPKVTKPVAAEPLIAQETLPVTTSTPVIAQTAVKDSLPADSLPPMDGFYKNEMYTNAKAFNYPAINSRDVKFFKRVWRDIDVKDPKNSLLNTPGATLAEMILEGVRTGKLTAYEPSATNNDSTFAKRIDSRSALSRFQDSAMVDKFDANGNKVSSQMVLNAFNPENVTKFRTKEDIYFDKKRSMVVTRIIGIAPLKAIQAAGSTVGEAPVFWLYFPQCRDFFATKDISDPDRNLYDTTLDDIFVQRKYASTINRATGSEAARTTAQLAAAATVPGATAADIINADQDKSVKSKQIEASIEKFKANTWDYKIKKTPTAAEKKAAAAAEKKTTAAEKNAEKASKKAADQTAKPTKS